jgi:hypothetical protein
MSRIIRLNSDGTYDTNFNSGGAGATGGFASPSVTAIYAQDNGKILVGTASTTYNGTAIGKLIRLNSDGTLDNSLSSNILSTINKVQAIIGQNDKKILIGGNFPNYVNNTANMMFRILPDGSAD